MFNSAIAFALRHQKPFTGKFDLVFKRFAGERRHMREIGKPEGEPAACQAAPSDATQLCARAPRGKRTELMHVKAENHGA
jgi:hypothetical protein